MADKAKAQPIITPEFVGSYVTLVKPRAIEEGKDPKYSINIVLKKKDPKTIAFIKKLEAAFNASMLDKLGKAIPFAALKHYPIHDGDKPNEDGEKNEITKGCWSIYAASNFKPGALNKRGEKLFTEDELYSGAIYIAAVTTWAWKHPTGGKGVSVNLDNVMKIRDGNRIGGGRKAEEDFAGMIDPDASDDDGEGADDDMLK
jgi:hypothetical protein